LRQISLTLLRTDSRGAAAELRGLADIVVEATGVSALAGDNVQLRGLTVTGASEWTLAITGRHRQQGESWSIEEGYLALRDLFRGEKLDGRDLISEIVLPSSAPQIYQALLGAERDLLGVVFDWRT
jgi:hypothetical protein